LRANCVNMTRNRYETYGRGQGDLAQFMKSQVVTDDDQHDSVRDTAAGATKSAGQMKPAGVTGTISKQSVDRRNATSMLVDPIPPIAALDGDMCVRACAVALFTSMCTRMYIHSSCSGGRPKKQSRASLLDILDDDDGGAVPRIATAAAAVVSWSSASSKPVALENMYRAPVVTVAKPPTSGYPLIASVSEFYDQVRVVIYACNLHVVAACLIVCVCCLKPRVKPCTSVEAGCQPSSLSEICPPLPPVS
jgi:hypothetical protein